MQLRVLMRVLEGQQLHCPFNVGQGTAAQFRVGVAVGPTRKTFFIDAGFHAADFPHRRIAHTALRVAELVDHMEEAAA